MATIRVHSGLLDMEDGTIVDFAGRDPAGDNSSTRYSWLTTAGHDVQATGNIAGAGDPPAAATIDLIGIDLDNDDFANPDITMSGLGGVSLVTITTSPNAFYAAILAGSDTFVGGAGDDRLFGRGGHDLIRGLSGDDSLDGGGGRD